MNVLKKKLYFTTLIKMGASFIFVVFTFAIIIATGALKDMGSYFKGFKAEKINSVSDLMKVTKFNTKIIEVKDIYPLNIEYFDGFTKKKKFQKQKESQGEYFLAEYNGAVLFIIGKEKSFVDKGNGVYEVKGKLEFLKKDFINEYYSTILQELNDPEILKPVVINSVSPWKRETGLYLTLIFFIGIPAILLFIKFLINFLNVENHPAYRNLKDYGDWKKIKEIVNNEIDSGKYEEYEAQLITENFIITQYMNLNIFPKNMILRAFVTYGLESKGNHNMARIEFLLFNGNYEELYSTEKRVEKVVQWLKEKNASIKIDEKNKASDLSFEIRAEMSKYWQEKLNIDKIDFMKIEEDIEIKNKREEYLIMIEKQVNKNI